MDSKSRALPVIGSMKGVRTISYEDNFDHPQDYSHTEVSDSRPALSRFNGFQITESESHPEWRRHHKGRFLKDLGGPFSTTKYECSGIPQGALGGVNKVQPIPSYPPWQQTTWYSYQGPFLPMDPGQIEWPTNPASSEDDLDELGSTAIARCSPTNPSADLSVTIGELVKEGFPALIGGTLRTWKSLSGQERRRAIGKEHLNYEFGWKPLVNDLTKLSRAIIDADMILNQYQRDSGKLVRRRYSFPPVHEEFTTTVKTNCSPWWTPSHNLFVNSSSVNQGRVIRSHIVDRRQWFSGAFTYYVPPADSMRNDMARQVIQAKKLLGLSLTPDNLWNLAPWSWAIDWFSNTGDVLSNWTDWAIDNLVLVYGYMMEQSSASYTYTFVGPTGLKPAGTRPIDMTLTVTSKIRRQATPYGFGLDWDTLSSRQKAIVASLGISRSK